MTDEDVYNLLTHKKKKRNQMFIALLLLIGVILLMIFLPNSKTSIVNDKKEIDYYKIRKDSYYTSQLFVKKYLKSPLSAEFPSWYDQENNVILKDGTFDRFIINSYVDAQNSFGAMIRKYYFCELEYLRDKDTWRLIDFRFK